MKKIICIFLFTLCSLYSFAQNSYEQHIRALLAKQVAAWNTGSIDGYMHGYWESDSLLFIGRTGPRYGYKTTLEKYKQAYPDTAQMGKLTFTVLSMKKLSPEYYFVLGRWALKRSVGDLSGASTLLLRRIKGKWVIVSDHSS